MQSLKVMLLAGGPDRERPVSLMSAGQVAQALREVGHDVEQHDIGPDDLAALDRFAVWEGDVVFPLLHGPWGEGGPLQQHLDDRNIPYVGTQTDSAMRCIDKYQTKQVLEQHDLPTPIYELIQRGVAPTLTLPLVAKAPCEGSSFDMLICHEADSLEAGLEKLFIRHEQLLLEQYIPGRELTVGVLGESALPTIEIVTRTSFYDYDAKYTRSDTQYLFDIDLPAMLLEEITRLALRAHQVLGCRHLSRWDFMVDQDHRPWILEVNTMPGFTSHSLLPMSAMHNGLDLPALVDRLVRMGAGLSD